MTPRRLLLQQFTLRIVHRLLLFSAVSACFAFASLVQAARVDAIAGEPFGVGVVTLPVVGDAAAALQDERFSVASADGRILYPIVKEQPVRRIIRQLLEIDAPANVTVYFLFRGDAPLEICGYAPQKTIVAATTRRDPRGHQQLLNEWWEAYGGRWKKLRQDEQFPPVVDNFVAANLARRLNLKLPGLEDGLGSLLSANRGGISALFSTEWRKLSADLSLLLPTEAADPVDALGPLPAPMPWPELLPLDGPAAPTESIAAHLPPECFYLRFGTFSNYLWFRDLKKKWDGDLANMIFRRGLDRAGPQRIEQQLALRENALAKILGPTVIADVAIVGLDPNTDLGAGVGVVFQAKNNLLLGSDLAKQRREALQKFADAQETTLSIADHDVSLISSPRGEVRSYSVVDGDFHLVATSRRLVERFLNFAADAKRAEGDRSLAETVGFQRARRQFAHDRGDALFIYLPNEFFREQSNPAMWIETQRRMRSMREGKLWELARLQAAAEGSPLSTLAELIDAGYLPPHFGEHADGSQLVVGADPQAGVADSLRGSPGLFVPASDMPATDASAAEAADYRLFADRFRQETGRLPPIAVAVRRIPLVDGSGDTLAADVLSTPLEGVNLGKFFDMLGEPSTERIAPVDGELARLEVVLKKLLPALSALTGPQEPHHLFAVVQDAPRISDQAVFGAWPRPGLLRMFSKEPLPDRDDPVALQNGNWHARHGNVIALGFSRDAVSSMAPLLKTEKIDHPAQAWLAVGNLAGTQLEKTVNRFSYGQVRETSLAASRLMNSLHAQLHVPPADCRAIAERLIDGQFVCPLGGEYQLVDVPAGEPIWSSSALKPDDRLLSGEAPEDFHLAVLTWLRGLRGELLKQPDALSAHVEIDMAKSAAP